MKPLNKSGGLVDKKEKLIFEAYKNKVIKSADVLRKEIKDNYGFEPSSDLYREILNYQIKKYGSALYLANTSKRDYVQYFGVKSTTRRRKHDELCSRNVKQNKMIERVEKRKRNASK